VIFSPFSRKSNMVPIKEQTTAASPGTEGTLRKFAQNLPEIHPGTSQNHPGERGAVDRFANEE